jgi:hypothetical protein
LIGGDGTVLDPSAAMPSVNATTGIFNGPMPASDGLEFGFASFLPGLVDTGSVTLTMDSVIPGSSSDPGLGPRSATRYFFSRQAGSLTGSFVVSISGNGQSAYNNTFAGANFPAAGYGQAAAGRFGGDSTYTAFAQVELGVGGIWGLTSKGRGDANDDPADSPSNGPRFWVGTGNENVDDPNGLNCPTVAGTFSCALPDLSRNAGAIAGVDLFGIQSYLTIPSSPMRVYEGLTSMAMRTADFRIYWGAAGVVDSVVDVTHRVRVPFHPRIRSSWGILTAASFAGVTAAPDGRNNIMTWSDIACTFELVNEFGACGGDTTATAVMQQTAALDSVAFASSSFAGTAGLAANGTGFIFYLGGYFTLMRTATLPTNTVWNMRTYSGQVTGLPGSYGFAAAIRPAAVPGLRWRITFSGSTLDPTTTTAASLERIHTVPDPYYVTNSLEITSSTKVLQFVNLPSQAIIRIYSASGVLVNILSHNDVGGGGRATWNLRNRNNQFVASGVYFYHVETPDGREKIGRFTVVNYAQ